MSVNNVLNRPMFRQVALRKGYLKPIKASNGNFVMSPTPTSFQTASNFRPPMNVPQPGFFRGTVMPAAGATGRFLKNQFGLRGLIGGGGTAMLSNDLLTKLGVGGPLKTGINIAAGALGVTPIGRAIGYGYTGLKGLGLLLDKIRRDNTNPNLQYGDTLKQITSGVIGGEPLLTGDKVINPFRPIDPSKRKSRGQVKKEREELKKLVAMPTEASEGAIDTSKLNVAKAEGEQNVKGTDSINVAEIKNKAIEKSTGVDGGLKGPVGAEPGAAMGPIIEGTIASKPEAPIKEPKKDTLGVSDIKKDTPFAQQIALAREIKAELMKGRDPGLARRTFLLNLAAGLMSGTTKKQGLAGAIDVFGQALGPASNNYATLKLKESELENNLMSEALEMATEQFKAANDIDMLEGDSGVVQIMGADGKLRNIAGKSLKDGSVQIAIPGALTQQGTQAFQTVPYGGYVRFIKREKANELQSKVLKDISGAYKGYAFNKINLQILEQAQRDNKQLAGPRGKLNLLYSRLSGAASDFDFSIGSNKADLNDFFTKDFLTEENIKSYAEDRNITTQRAENELKKQMEEIYKERQTQLKAFISPVGTDDSQDLERLAINETITVYALANALKSKDRLTQKDIQNARELVNIFPIGKGQVQVIQSLRAINETLIKDIERLENDFTNQAFGDYIILEQYRNKYGLSLGETEAPAGTTKDKPTSELLEGYDK
jgi:hypothetical protein